MNNASKKGPSGPQKGPRKVGKRNFEVKLVFAVIMFMMAVYSYMDIVRTGDPHREFNYLVTFLAASVCSWTTEELPALMERANILFAIIAGIAMIITMWNMTGGNCLTYGVIVLCAAHPWRWMLYIVYYAVNIKKGK